MGSENEIIEKIRKVPEVVEVYRVFGVYDIIVRISTSDMETLKEIIAWKIKNLVQTPVCFDYDRDRKLE